MSVASNIAAIRAHVPASVSLVCVSKFHNADTIMEAYRAGERIFGESRVQEIVEKHPFLPHDVEWHFIGHLQTNKIKNIIGFVQLIHGVDSLKLLQAIDAQATKVDVKVRCLLQIHIAEESTKFGFLPDELNELLSSDDFKLLKHVEIAGLMGMATYTDDLNQVRKEFRRLKQIFDEVKERFFAEHASFSELSMGMSGDYEIAIEEGSTMVRVGTAIFGDREY